MCEDHVHPGNYNSCQGYVSPRRVRCTRTVTDLFLHLFDFQTGVPSQTPVSFFLLSRVRHSRYTLSLDGVCKIHPGNSGRPMLDWTEAPSWGST